MDHRRDRASRNAVSGSHADRKRLAAVLTRTIVAAAASTFKTSFTPSFRLFTRVFFSSFREEINDRKL